MTLKMAPKRVMCPICGRPQVSCLCQWVRPTAHQVEVVVLQHPMEVDNAKGSARLLCLSLAHSRLVTAEVLAEAQLHALLSEPLPGAAAGPPRQAVLLYPHTPQDQALGLRSAPMLGTDQPYAPSLLRLIVLDGTWRKSRKMLYQNPLLQALPRLALRDLPASHYLIRKAHQRDQLSTLEATCAALTQLEGRREAFAPLLTAFDGFVAQHMAYRASSPHPAR